MQLHPLALRSDILVEIDFLLPQRRGTSLLGLGLLLLSLGNALRQNLGVVVL
jgi:hypothetical protein